MVRPTMEFASPVWDAAARSIKEPLDRIQRAALLKMTGANPSSSTAALESYCDIPGLQDRRDFLTCCAFFRIRCLGRGHPISLFLKVWLEPDFPAPTHALTNSFFRRALALTARLQRFYD